MVVVVVISAAILLVAAGHETVVGRIGAILVLDKVAKAAVTSLEAGSAFDDNTAGDRAELRFSSGTGTGIANGDVAEWGTSGGGNSPQRDS